MGNVSVLDTGRTVTGHRVDVVRVHAEDTAYAVRVHLPHDTVYASFGSRRHAEAAFEMALSRQPA